MPTKAFKIASEYRLGSTRLQSGQHRSCLGIGLTTQKKITDTVVGRDGTDIESVVQGALEPSRGNTPPICLANAAICSLYGVAASTTGMSRSTGRASPWLEPNHGFSAKLPSAAKSGRVAFSRITAVSAMGMWAILTTTAPFAD